MPNPWFYQTLKQQVWVAVSQQYGRYLLILFRSGSVYFMQWSNLLESSTLQRIYQISFLADTWHENASDGKITPFTKMLTSYINSYINNVRVITGHTNNATADTFEGQFRLSLIFMSIMAQLLSEVCLIVCLSLQLIILNQLTGSLHTASHMFIYQVVLSSVFSLFQIYLSWSSHYIKWPKMLSKSL